MNDITSMMPTSFPDKEGMFTKLAFQNRKILMYDDIDDNSVLRTIYALMRLKEADTKLGTKDPINIYINSSGGSVYDGLTLISLIESMQDEGYEINTINMGYAMSMAFLISVIGTHRYAFRYATYMVHDIASSSGFSKLQAQKNQMQESERLRDIYSDIITHKTSLGDNDLADVYDHQIDRYIDSQEALNLNICDKII